MLTKRIAYNAKITLGFSYSGKHVNINPIKIAYVMIDSDYDNNVIPTIYVSLLTNDNEYKLINENKDNATFNLCIKKYALNSDTTLEKTVINDTFNYIPSTSSANMMEQLNADPKNTEGSYRRILLGLVSTDMVNKLRKSFNGIYKNINQSTLVSLALEGLNAVIEPMTYNEEYKILVVPPVSTRFKLLDFIFNKDPFYDTNFRFFMDFERAYLLSKRGDPISAQDGAPNDVIIDIVQVTANEAMYQGISIMDGSYYLHINPVNVGIIKDESQEKIVNNVTVVDELKGNTNLDIDYDTTSSLKSKNIYVRATNPSLIKNELELGKSMIEVIKEHADGSVLTPNKCYTIKNFPENAIFNGKYILSYKREFFKANVSDFTMSVDLGLKKVGKLNPLKQASKTNGKAYTAIKNAALSATANKTTTASKKK